MQNICMQHAFFLPDLQTKFWDLAIAPDSLKDDCCTWRNVDCSDGIVTSVVFAPYRTCFGRNNVITVALEWLPSSLQSFHVTGGRVRDLVFRALPRSLKYIFFRSSPYNPKIDVLYTSHLPEHLEEAHLRMSMHISLRSIVIDQIPSKLRFFDISNSNGIQRVFVCNPDLSNQLGVFRILSGTKKNRAIVHCTDGTKPDFRIQSVCTNASESELMKLFVYYPEHAAKASRL